MSAGYGRRTAARLAVGSGRTSLTYSTAAWSPDGRRLIFAIGGRLKEWEVNGQSRELWVSGDRLQSMTPRWTDGVLTARRPLAGVRESARGDSGLPRPLGKTRRWST
jgi:hypothetical protein